MIIQPRKPQGPKEGDVTTALNLMVSLGGQSETSLSYLTDLLAAIKHNSALLENINAARADLSTLERREKALVEGETRNDAKLAEIETIHQSFKKYDSDVKAGKL
jgi:hypothetical protein